MSEESEQEREEVERLKKEIERLREENAQHRRVLTKVYVMAADAIGVRLGV